MDKQVMNDLPDIREIRGLSKLNPFRSLLAILTEWLLIAGAVALHIYFPHPGVYLISWVIIGSRMYALYSLLHDGIHYLLFPQKQVNDWLCKIFLAGPLFIPLRKMRKFHLTHHQYLRTSNDPEAAHLSYDEFQFPKSASELAFIFLKDITGFNFIFYKIRKLILWLKSLVRKENQQENNLTEFELVMLFYYLVIGMLVIYMGWGMPFLLYWIIPYITVYQALNRLRLSTEHFHLPADKTYQTRTVRLNFAERFLFSPHNLGLHAEHHLYPSVPFYRLPTLHRSLMKVSEFRNNVVVKNSYLTVIRDFIKR